MNDRASESESSGPNIRKGSVFNKPVDLDDVLVNELGQFGRYQLLNLLLLSAPLIMSAFPSEFIFSAAAIPHSLIKAIWNSSVLLRRVCTTPIWWITTTFVYYGLSINATSLSETMHLNYILTAAIEIPGFYTAVLVLDRIGRKPTICTGFLFSAVCNIAFTFTPQDMATLRLIIYLLGKFGISMVFTSIYLFTSELYPTKYRHSLLAFSSMVGRIGSITAPLTPALMEYYAGIPTLMFGAMGILSGILVLTQPETLGTKLPDTLEEAEVIGLPESMRQR
ncbi:unnamed protein product [Arctia plantaginis]|uniref:Major facilitator superfamily (MFS) profile domain-containing protein n=1 Tax=Arctia plantaginis TaxID=874455 RepID=A0A8S1AG63_ARCPL|nr:unnamed protein product [Arctia plantaginis]